MKSKTEIRWASKKDAAIYAGVTAETIRRWCRDKRIRQSPKRAGVRQRVDLRSIDEYLEGRDEEEK